MDLSLSTSGKEQTQFARNVAQAILTVSDESWRKARPEFTEEIRSMENRIFLNSSGEGPSNPIDEIELRAFFDRYGTSYELGVMLPQCPQIAAELLNYARSAPHKAGNIFLK